jgi:hypothetical protein
VSAELLNQSNATITFLSFECAAARAQAAGQGDVAALAKLRLARLGLQFMEAAPEAANSVRPVAIRNALDGLRSAHSVSAGPLRAELTGRLASVLLDLGETGNRLVQDSPALMRTADANASARAYASAIEGRLALAAGRQEQAAGLLRAAVLLESQRVPFPPDWPTGICFSAKRSRSSARSTSPPPIAPWMRYGRCCPASIL